MRGHVGDEDDDNDEPDEMMIMTMRAEKELADGLRCFDMMIQRTMTMMAMTMMTITVMTMGMMAKITMPMRRERALRRPEVAQHIRCAIILCFKVISIKKQVF